MSLSERGERTLDDLDENLEALKRTWPLSRYFDRRGFDDRNTVLYQPGAERETRVLAADALFEPGRAVLTAGGRKELDAVGTWFNKLRRPKSTEIVIAAFTDDTSVDEPLARRLTQEQAEAVRRYLNSAYKLDSAGLFRSRRVAAVGFGTEVPHALAAADAPPRAPGRRVEIIIFTPQT